MMRRIYGGSLTVRPGSCSSIPQLFGVDFDSGPEVYLGCIGDDSDYVIGGRYQINPNYDETLPAVFGFELWEDCVSHYPMIGGKLHLN